ncbi:MAG TPA: GNAT family N-acetyltransferase [Verrucomicrobiae bacterium]|nr:GNAT family N-acetyltransferase [Verrucomicrobiae bacterium]
MTANEALSPLRSGMRVFIGSGCAAPQTLVEALVARAPEVYDVEIIHILTHGPAPYARPELAEHFRQNSMFIGGNVRASVHQGRADYTPIFLSEIPRLFRERRMHLHVALVQVSPPDNRGFCSFGVSVDVVKAAVESADYVVAEVNPAMPRTLGDSFVHVSSLDALVESDRPVLEFPMEPITPEARKIAEFIAALVPDGATLQTGIGSIPSAVLSALADKKNLGVHTEMITEAVMPLVEAGVINGRRKTLRPRKIVTSFCFGTKDFYKYIHKNRDFEFHPTEFTNDPFQIASNRNMVAISSAIEVDLTGQVCADSIGGKFYSGFGGQVDFIRGAAKAENGKPIIALPSTTKDGAVSRIVPWLKTGAGVVTSRADVHYVVTEYGVADLFGKTVRERAIALIHIAHPKFRDELLEQAREAQLVDPSQIALPEGLQPYPKEFETDHEFAGKLKVHFRPIQPTDERRLQELFHSHSPSTIYQRYFAQLKHLPRETVQRMVTIDYRNAMAIVGEIPWEGATRLIAVGRYYRDESSKWAEVAVTVQEDFQRRGIATFLLGQLAKAASAQGIVGFKAEVLSQNAGMLKTFFKAAKPVQTSTEAGVVTVRFELKDMAKPG